MTDKFDELFNTRLADRINESHEYSDKYYYAKLKCRVFDFLYHQYKTNIVNFTKLRMFKEYRISHPDDNIGLTRFTNYLKEYFDIMNIDYKNIHVGYCRKYANYNEAKPTNFTIL